MRLWFYAILEIVFFLIFVYAGEFPGFVIWVVLSCACYYIHRLVSVKEAEFILKEREFNEKHSDNVE